ncbi:MAG: DUF177 domain-containing protein [Caldilineales bacterium]|nr:DUF177 domain-containing protein [Caldilineales bacterium]
MSTQSVHLQDLQFNVAGLLKGPVGGVRQYDLHVPTSELDQIEESFDVTGPFEGSVNLLRTADTVLARAHGTTTVRLECARCLEPTDMPIAVKIEEEFWPSIDVNTGRPLHERGDDEALIIDEQHILDLTEVMRQSLLVALPIMPLCRDDCQGLCPTCGVNRNLQTCDCVDVDTDPRWAALGALLSFDEEES